MCKCTVDILWLHRAKGLDQVLDVPQGFEDKHEEIIIIDERHTPAAQGGTSKSHVVNFRRWLGNSGFSTFATALLSCYESVLLQHITAPYRIWGYLEIRRQPHLLSVRRVLLAQ